MVKLKTILRFISSILVCYVAVFLIAKLLFMGYNHSAEEWGVGDIIAVVRHGLPMDLSTSAYLTAIPWLLCLVAVWWRRLPLRGLLIAYFAIISILLAFILLGDTLLYEYWKFKLDASIFSYVGATRGAVQSVSMAYVIGGVVAYLLMAGLLGYMPVRITLLCFGKKGRESRVFARDKHNQTLNRLGKSLTMVLLGGILFVCIRGGVQEGTMNPGTAYFSDKLFLNHSAVNPAFNLFYSCTKRESFDKQFRFMDDAECSRIFEGLYPEDTDDVSDSLLTTTRPKILYIQLESFGAQFIKELGGYPDVCPNISRFIEEGIFFDNMYANSFRTDRGTISAISGHVSYPTVSLMRYPAKLDGLPSIPRTLVREGYSTDYFYGGDITIMGKQGYLISAGFQHLVSSSDFSMAQANETKWGVNDSTIMDRAFETIISRPDDALWFTGVQTLNSHEPFEVPYQRLEDKVQNAFAYTDHCLGTFIDRLRETPIWDRLLIILMPDHGLMHEMSYENPEFFHIPMLWMGGAIREPRRIHTLMNQSDLTATLLSQMGISHKEFRWSRNILSAHYTYPFAFASSPNGMLFADSTGISIYDLTANRVITEQPAPSQERISRAKAILQTSYDELAQMGPQITGKTDKQTE